MKWLLIACLGLLPATMISQEGDNDLFTNTYAVRSDFLEKIQDSDAAPINVTKHFENQGIPFPPGGVVMYYPSTSQLMVRNAEEEMKLVSEFIDTLNDAPLGKQVYITLREVTIQDGALNDEIFDGLLRPLEALLPADPFPGLASPLDSREAFLEEFSRPPRLPNEDKATPERSLGGISGVYTDPQFQIMIRALERTEGVDVLSTPSVMTRSGQPGLIQIKEKRWGAIADIGSDGYTIDLELFFPRHGEPLFGQGEAPRSSGRVTIWDGQTVAWAEKLDDKATRAVFIRAQLMDPAGTPLNEPSPIQPRLNESPPVKDLQGSNEKYEVQKGDTLHSIALRSGISVSKLSDANFLSSNMLQVGQKLVIPEP
ncbi:MAG: LysM peptidoglycan-binding domain-containing protein [Verrucomicrobiales bacterium]|nr:LysM peptidoglycan-binding domain-containing protein [Verrucomicrobiales bacterium]